MGHFFITKGNNSYDATHLLYYEDRSFWFTFNFFITKVGIFIKHSIGMISFYQRSDQTFKS